MELNKEQFDILAGLAELHSNSQRISTLDERLMFSDTARYLLTELTELGYIGDDQITDSSIKVLEPYKAKRAIFIAAGFGSRLVPITINTPKPLVRVNGKRIIDTLIDACLAADINEIYIVRGYLGEQFDQLLYKYPMIKFLDNPDYSKANNISSVALAKDLLSNAYVFEADLFLSNPDIITKYHYTSDFLAIKKDKTNDWCFTEKDGFITEEKIGGENCWQMVGISYWNKEDGIRLKTDIENIYDTDEGKNLYWEQVPLVYRKDNYNVAIRECSDNDIVEIDTFEELKAIDKKYNTGKDK